MRHTLIELAHLAISLIAVAAVTECAAWAYPLGRDEIAWIGRIVAIGVVAWGVPKVREAIAADRTRDAGQGAAHG